MPIFDFRCNECGTIAEELVAADTHVLCKKCGNTTTKLIGVPRVNWLAMGAQRNASPEAIAKFDKMHRQRKATEDKCYAENGDYGPAAGA